MNHKQLTVLTLSIIFAGVVPTLFAEAPIVDESENYAILNQQSSSNEAPETTESSDNPQPPAEAIEAENTTSTTTEEPSPLAQESTTSNQETLSLLNRQQALQEEIQELRGQLEVQAHDLKLLQQQQLAFYKDLDNRLNHATATAKVDQNPVISSARANPADEQVSYLAAYELVKQKAFDKALPAMLTFVKNYPQGGYTANAQYWIGELYLVKKNYSEAINHFESVVHDFQTSSKSAPSLLKIGYILAETGKKAEAIQKLEHVISQYPDTNSAHLAKEKLGILRS